jgi:hypothetical protein
MQFEPARPLSELDVARAAYEASEAGHADHVAAKGPHHGEAFWVTEVVVP